MKTELKPNTETEIELEEKVQLRPLTSLNWPYVPEESAYPDPLKRDDPKPLQLNQYEAIGAFASILSHAFTARSIFCGFGCGRRSLTFRSFSHYAHGIHWFAVRSVTS